MRLMSVASLSVLSAMIALSGCATSVPLLKDKAPKAAASQQSTAKSAPAKPKPAPTLANAATISAAPAQVSLKDWNPKKIWSKKPNVAVVDYNVGTYLTARETASVGGGLNRVSARSTLELRMTNVTPALSAEIAEAAYEDLQALFAAAGAALVEPSAIQAHPDAAKLGLGGAPFEAKITGGRAKKSIAIAGPASVGGTKFASLGRTTFNWNGAAKLSNDLDAVVVFPNAALDFVSTKSGGSRALGLSARVTSDVRFSLGTASVTSVSYSKSGRYTDLPGNLTLPKDVVVDGEFATTE